MSKAETKSDAEETVEYEARDNILKDDSGKVVEMDRCRSKQSGMEIAAPAKPSDADGVWEWTSQPLLPPESGKVGDSSTVEAPHPPVRIVKVSSGFGRLHVPAWDDSVRCRAA